MNKKRFVDTAAIVQVIGNIYNNVSLLDNEDYHFYEEDFTEEFHKILFGSIFNLHAMGVKEITPAAIEDYLEQRPKKLGIYKVNKGFEYLQSISEACQLATFNYYYQRVKKMTLLRMYDDIGFDVSFLYDPDNIFDAKKKQVQEDWLDNTALEDIAEIIDKKISDIRLKYVDDANDGAVAAGTGALALLESLRENPEIGYPMFGPLINTVTKGARLKKFYLRSAATGVGKAIPNDTLIPTPKGWRKVGEIKVGDYLFGQDGKPTKVLATYPQSEKKEIWEVEFSDGRIAKCCGEHLWEYGYEGHKTKQYRVEDISTLYNRTLSLKNGLRTADNKGFRFHVRLNKPVEYEKQEYSIDPYVMGLIIGDGSFRYSDINKAFNFSSQDEELPAEIAKRLGKYTYKKNSDYNYNYTFKPLDNLKHNLWVEELLKDYPDMWQSKSEDKYIPKEYLMGDIEQRYDLLAGLLDTDGSINEKGRVNFSTVSPNLRDDIIELARSLGMIATYLIDERENKYTTGKCYRVTIQAKKEIKPKMFKLSRKVRIATEYANSNKRSEYKDHLAIVNIVKTEKKTDMTCFTVDNDSHLFLMNDYITTHNTRAMIADACNLACNELYNSAEGKWVSNGTSEPTIFIPTEQELDEIQTMMIAFISDVDEDRIINNAYYAGEWERVCKAAQILENSPLYVQPLPDFSLKDIENTIKRGIRDWDVRYVFFDYIHTSMKILTEVTSKTGIKGLREDNVLFMISIRLKDLCNQYGIFILTATQLNAEYTTAQQYDQNLLRGAKSIADKIDCGMIMLECSQEDLVSLEDVISKGGFEQPVIKISIYKNRRGRYKNILLWCKANRGTCKIEPMFATNYQYELVPIEDMKINVKPKVDASAF